MIEYLELVTVAYKIYPALKLKARLVCILSQPHAIGALFDAVCKSNFKTFSTAHSHMCLPSASILGLPIMSHDSTFCFTKIARSAISRTPSFHSKLILPFLKFAFPNGRHLKVRV